MLAVDIKADHDIVAQRFILGIGIKAVHLHSPFVGKDCFLQRIAYLGGFIIGGVVGIDTYACEDNSCFLKDIYLYAAGYSVDIVNGHGIGKLDMDGAVVFIRSVVEKDYIVGAPYVLVLADELAQTCGDLGIAALTDDIVKSFKHHFDARFDDKAGDDYADIRFKGYIPDQADDC